MDKKFRDGVTVQEIENFGKKYQFEIFLTLFFALPTIFSFLFFGYGWSLFFAGLGAVVGVLLCQKIEKIFSAAFRFTDKQDKVTKIVLAIGLIVIAFFVPPAAFLVLGLAGGKSLRKLASHVSSGESKER